MWFVNALNRYLLHNTEKLVHLCSPPRMEHRQRTSGFPEAKCTSNTLSDTKTFPNLDLCSDTSVPYSGPYLITLTSYGNTKEVNMVIPGEEISCEQQNSAGVGWPNNSAILLTVDVVSNVGLMKFYPSTATKPS